MAAHLVFARVVESVAAFVSTHPESQRARFGNIVFFLELLDFGEDFDFAVLVELFELRGYLGHYFVL